EIRISGGGLRAYRRRSGDEGEDEPGDDMCVPPERIARWLPQWGSGTFEHGLIRVYHAFSGEQRWRKERSARWSSSYSTGGDIASRRKATRSRSRAPPHGTRYGAARHAL